MTCLAEQGVISSAVHRMIFFAVVHEILLLEVGSETFLEVMALA